MPAAANEDTQDLQDMIRDGVGRHSWVPYYGPANLDVKIADREWAAKHRIYKCELCGCWIWLSCKGLEEGDTPC